MQNQPTIKQLVEFGLEKIPAEQTVEVRVRDLLYVHQVLGELVRFFHQSEHFPDLAAIERYLGDKESGGAFEVITTAYYGKLRDMLPTDLDDKFADGEFQHPDPPAYYDPAT